MSALLAPTQPRRIKATHRWRRKIASGRFVQRYYDAEIGRFISPDPIQTDPNSGSSFNRYWCADNNPIKNLDPDGRASLACGSSCTNEDFERWEMEDSKEFGAFLISLPAAAFSGRGLFVGFKYLRDNPKIRNEVIYRICEAGNLICGGGYDKDGAVVPRKDIPAHQREYADDRISHSESIYKASQSAVSKKPTAGVGGSKPNSSADVKVSVSKDGKSVIVNKPAQTGSRIRETHRIKIEPKE